MNYMVPVVPKDKSYLIVRVEGSKLWDLKQYDAKNKVWEWVFRGETRASCVEYLKLLLQPIHGPSAVPPHHRDYPP